MAKQNKWFNEKMQAVAALIIECDSCAAIEGACLTREEREAIQKKAGTLLKFMRKIAKV